MTGLVDVSGYVLAGGKSSRMGSDKALLLLGGRRLIEIAVEKLGQVCADVSILSSRAELGRFGTLVADLHGECGPLGGMESALVQAQMPWSLFLAVDMPFVPVEFIRDWVGRVLLRDTVRIALFTADGVPQPTLCLVHRDVTPFVQQAIADGRYKVWPVLASCSRELAERLGQRFEDILLNDEVADAAIFANLNTPQEFAEARTQIGREQDEP